MHCVLNHDDHEDAHCHGHCHGYTAAVDEHVVVGSGDRVGDDQAVGMQSEKSVVKLIMLKLSFAAVWFTCDIVFFVRGRCSVVLVLFCYGGRSGSRAVGGSRAVRRLDG